MSPAIVLRCPHLTSHYLDLRWRDSWFGQFDSNIRKCESAANDVSI